MKLFQLLPSLGVVGAISVLVTQPVLAQVREVTGIKLNSTQNSIEVILESPAAQQLQVLPRIAGNTYIADIPNAQLRLEGGNTFRQNNPTAGITAITVTNEATNSIRVTVTGSSGVPSVELFDSDEGFIFSFTPAGVNAQQTETPNTVEPGSEAQQETPTTPEAVERGSAAQATEQTEGDEPIEIVVTATRTEEAL